MTTPNKPLSFLTRNAMLMQTMSRAAADTRPQTRIATQPIRAIAITLYTCVVVIDFTFRTLGLCGQPPPSRFVIVVAIMLGLTALELSEQRLFGNARPALALAVGLIALRIATHEVVTNFECSGFNQFLLLIPPLLAYLYIGSRSAIGTAVLMMALNLRWHGTNLMNFEAAQEENVLIEILILVVGLVFTLVIGRVLVLEEKNRERSERLLTELERSQQQIMELAQADERNRIARDIHDSVGHHLTAVNIQIEKAIAFREIDAAEADQALLDAKRSAKSALADVRDSVSALRDTDSHYELGSALRELVEGFGSAEVDLIIEGNETSFSKSTLLTLYRVAQEGLTNIAKHANATQVKLHVQLMPGAAMLNLTDNGSGFDTELLEQKFADGDAHFGLIGLRERLETVGGSLNVTSGQNQGTTLRVSVPAKGLS